MTESLTCEKRESIKRKINDRKYGSLPETVLDGTGKLFLRFTRSKLALPYWGSGIVIALITMLLSTLVSTLLNEIHSSTIRNSVLMALWTLIIGYICSVGMYRVLHLIYKTLYDPVIDSIESITDLENLEDWLHRTSCIRRQILFSAGFAVIMTACFCRLTVRRFRALDQELELQPYTACFAS